MIRKLLTLVMGVTAILVVVAIVDLTEPIVGAFFAQLGGESHTALGGVSGESAINYPSLIDFLLMSFLGVPVALGLYYFMSGGDRRHPRSPPRGR